MKGVIVQRERGPDVFYVRINNMTAEKLGFYPMEQSAKTESLPEEIKNANELATEWFDLPRSDFRNVLARLVRDEDVTPDEIDQCLKAASEGQHIFMDNDEILNLNVAANNDFDEVEPLPISRNIAVVLDELDGGPPLYLKPRKTTYQDLVDSAKKMYESGVIQDGELDVDVVIDLSNVSDSDIADPDKMKVWYEMSTLISDTHVKKLSDCFFNSGEVTLADLDTLYPPEMRQLVSELNVIDRHRLWNYLFDELVFMASGIERDYLVSSDFKNKNIDAFLSGHMSELSPAWLKELLLQNVDDISFDQVPNVDTTLHDIVVGAMTHEAMSKQLIKEERHPIAILETYKAYKSCAETEGKLIKEMMRNEALVLDLQFEDGTYVRTATKFDEVTLLTVLETTNPLFEVGMSYLPVGETVRDINQIRQDEQLLYDHVVIPDKMKPLVFAKNRPLELDDWDKEDFIKRADGLRQKYNAQVAKTR